MSRQRSFRCNACMNGKLKKKEEKKKNAEFLKNLRAWNRQTKVLLYLPLVFIVSVAFYILFCLQLLFFCLLFYFEEKRENLCINSFFFLSFFLFVCFFFCREIGNRRICFFQINLSPRKTVLKYFFSTETKRKNYSQYLFFQLFIIFIFFNCFFLIIINNVGGG